MGDIRDQIAAQFFMLCKRVRHLIERSCQRTNFILRLCRNTLMQISRRDFLSGGG